MNVPRTLASTSQLWKRQKGFGIVGTVKFPSSMLYSQAAGSSKQPSSKVTSAYNKTPEFQVAKTTPTSVSGDKSISEPSSRSRASQSKTTHGPTTSNEKTLRPVIVSLALNKELQNELSELRTKYFPPERNYLPGHITLFHALPSENLDFLKRTLTFRCQEQVPFPVSFAKPRLTNNAAVLIPLKANKLQDLRRNLLLDYEEHLELTEQDARRNYAPHLTVVNKVNRQEAQRVYDELSSIQNQQQPLQGQAVGLDFWYYKGGPWEYIDSVSFGPKQ